MLKVFSELKRNSILFHNKRYFTMFLSNEAIINNSLKKLDEVLKNQSFKKQNFFYSINPMAITLNNLQEGRFHLNNDNKILLFENSLREKAIKELISFSYNRNFVKFSKNQAYLTGPRGVGKSHTLALTTLYLKGLIEGSKDQADRFRVFYVNNPLFYYCDFESALINDLVLCLAEDLKTDEELKKKLAELSYDESSIYNFFKYIRNYFEMKNVISIVCFDQINILDRKEHSNLEQTKILKKIQESFNYSITSASNNNKTINFKKKYGNEVYIGAKQFFSDDSDVSKEVETYIKTLKYFGNLNENQEFIQKVKTLTNLNPYELMRLNDMYNKQIWDQKIGFEANFNRLKTDYLELRMDEIGISHRKFIFENCRAPEDKNIFLRNLSTMDFEIIPKNLEQFLNYIDYNLMEIDNNTEFISSICPAAKIFLDITYSKEKLNRQETDLIKKGYYGFYKKERSEKAFQRLVEFWLKDGPTSLISLKKKKIPFGFSTDSSRASFYAYQLEDLKNDKNFLDRLKEKKNTLITIGDFTFDLIDFFFIFFDSQKNGYIF